MFQCLDKAEFSIKFSDYAWLPYKTQNKNKNTIVMHEIIIYFNYLYIFFYVYYLFLRKLSSHLSDSFVQLSVFVNVWHVVVTDCDNETSDGRNVGFA